MAGTAGHGRNTGGVVLGLGRRRAQDGAAATATRIDANLSGAVISGQVAVGEHIVQIHAEHGAIVNYNPPAQRPVPRPRPTPVRRLPRAFDALLGRDALLAELHRSLANGGPAELVGEPGIGKTSVLRNVSHHLAELKPDGVVYSAVRGTPESDLLQFLFESFFDCGGEIVVATEEELSRYLSERRALIVLDDLELDRDGLAHVMDTATSSTFLSASAARRVWGEGTSLDVGGLDEGAALALLEVELGRPLSAEERPIAIRWCGALNGSPLRILQLGALLRDGVRPHGSAPDRPADTARDALERALAGRLSEADRRVLAPLLTMPGVPIPAPAVTAASGIEDATDRLAALEGGHVVQSHSPRYTIAGEPGQALLSGVGHDEDAEREQASRARLVRAVVSDAADDSGANSGADSGPDSGADSRRLAEGELLLALARDAGKRGATGEVLALAHAADTVLGLSGRWGAWRLVLDAALQAARLRGSTAEEAWARHQLGSRALGLGETAVAAAQLGRALQLRESIGDRAGAAVTRHNLDLLSGPPPGNGGPPRPRPRLPLIAAGALVLALAAGVGVAVGLTSGGHKHSTVTTTSSINNTTITHASTTTRSTTTTSSTTSTPTSTTSTSSSSSTPPPPPVFAFNPDPPVVQMDLSKPGFVTGFGKVQVTNISASGVTALKPAVSSAEAFGTDTSGCAVLNHGDSCFVYMTFRGTTAPGAATLVLTFTLNGATMQQPAKVTLCEPPPQPTTTPPSTSTTTTTTTTTSSTTTYPTCPG